MKKFIFFLKVSGLDYPSIDQTVVIIFVTIALVFLLKTKMWDLFSWIWKIFDGKKNISEEGFQNDIKEIQTTTEQIVKDWVWMSKLIKEMQNAQKYFVSHLQSMFEDKSKMLEQNINSSMEEIVKSNDERFEEMKLRIGTMQEDVQSIKSILQTSLQLSSSELDGKAGDEENKTDSSAKTDCQMKKEIRVDEMNRGDAECEASKLTETLKNALTGIFKDGKMHLSIDREEENRELEIIFTKLAEDREDIKRTILEAFSIAAEQAKENYNKFGRIGKDALKYIAVLNGNTNKLLQAKFDETGDVLKNTLSVVNRQTHDIYAVCKIINNMDGEFCELFLKLEEINKLNMEHYEEITLNLVRISNNCIQNVSETEKMTKQIFDSTEFVKQICQEVKDLAYSSQQIDESKGKEKEKGEIVQNNEVDRSTIQGHKLISGKQENTGFVYSSWERMRSVSINVEDGCHSICELICGLEQKIGSLNESIVKLDEFIRGLNLDILAGRATSMDFNGHTARTVDGIMQISRGDAGDGNSQVITNRLKNTSLSFKIQNAIAADNAGELTEMIVRKVVEENNLEDNENSTQSKPNNLSITAEESPSTLATDEDQKC